MKKVIAATGIFLIGALLFACAPKVAPAEKPTTPKTQVQTPQAAETAVKQPWEQKWDDTLKEARKEGKIVMFAAGAAIAGPKAAIGLFKTKFGLDLDLVSFGRGPEATTKLLSERKAGIYLVDVFGAGMNTNVVTKKQGAFDPLEPVLFLPDVVDRKLWVEGELPWGDKERTIINYALYPSADTVAINTQMVKPDDIKSYYDLLEPKWKGKILVNDPTKTGTAFNAFSSVLMNKALDLDYFRQLARQEITVIRDDRIQIDWLSKGKYPIALWPLTTPFYEYVEAGAPIAPLYLKEGSYLTSGGTPTSLVNRAPHPSAARLFLNWMLSREGQIHLQRYGNVQSARVDIPTEGLDPLRVRQPGKKYLIGANNLEDWILNEQDRYLDMAKQIFEPLIR